MADWKEEANAQFKISYDKISGSFRILNLYHDDVKNLPIDADIPDNTLALKVLSGLEVNSLLGKLKEMGWLDKLFGSQIQNDIQTIQPARKSLSEIAIENITMVAKDTIPEGIDSTASKEAIAAIKDIVNKSYGVQ